MAEGCMGWNELHFVNNCCCVLGNKHAPHQTAKANLITFWLITYFHFSDLMEQNEPKPGHPLPTTLLASRTCTSFSVHFIGAVFGIQLTGQCAAKGRWGSGSVINYRQISSYKDPTPLEHHFSWRLVNLINQQPSPQDEWPTAKHHRTSWPGPSTFCMSHQCAKVGRCRSRDGCLIVKKEMPTHFLGVHLSSLPSRLRSHFYLLSVCAWCMHNTRRSDWGRSC